MRTLPDVVVVLARADGAEPAQPPQLAVTVVGPLADLLVYPAAPDQPPRTVLVDLTADGIDVPLHPVPMTLTVVLTTPSTGEPRAGRTVTARATSGPNPRPTVDLMEGEPGVYRSDPFEWTAAFTPLDLLVDGSQLRTLYVDLTRSATRIHLIDNT